jgi:hypothetical protein
LEEEGVVFNEKNRVDLKKFGWTGNDEEPNQPVLF